MKFFLVKSDPDSYGMKEFVRDKTTVWDGVHNNQAIGFIKSMKIGDRVYIYHSQSDKAIVGLAEVSGEPFHNTKDPRLSWAVELKLIHHTSPVTLADIKGEVTCKDFLLVRNPRLSVMPVPDEAAAWLEQSTKPLRPM